jgi:hypothetical protein
MSISISSVVFRNGKPSRPRIKSSSAIQEETPGSKDKFVAPPRLFVAKLRVPDPSKPGTGSKLAVTALMTAVSEVCEEWWLGLS